MATKLYNIFVLANSNAEDTSIVYNNKCNGCINKLNIYSLNHISKACALPSFILSIGYVNATNGAIIVKNAIYKTLFKYVNIKYTVNNTNITNITAYPAYVVVESAPISAFNLASPNKFVFH